MNPTAKNLTATPEPIVHHRRIGSTLYKVNVYFNSASKETFEEKALRLMKNDLSFTSNNITMKPLQAGRLSKRSSA